nr:ATP synthase F0 subunit 8 [Stenopelmatus sp.]
MPQMAPISWLILFIMFSITLMLFVTMNYFMTLNKTLHTKGDSKLTIKSLNWKW